MGAGLIGGGLAGASPVVGTNLTLSGNLVVLGTTALGSAAQLTVSAAAGSLITTGSGGFSQVSISTRTAGVLMAGASVLFMDALNAMQMIGVVTDGAAAVATKLGNFFALATPAAKVVGFYNDNVTTLVGGIGFRGTLYSGAATIPDGTGTPGSATVNSPRGRNAFANLATTCTITNDQCTANSCVFFAFESDPGATARGGWVVVNGGNFVVTTPAGVTGVVNFRWWVVN